MILVESIDVCQQQIRCVCLTPLLSFFVFDVIFISKRRKSNDGMVLGKRLRGWWLVTVNTTTSSAVTMDSQSVLRIAIGGQLRMATVLKILATPADVQQVRTDT